MCLCVAPLARIKQAMESLRQEIHQMDIRVGVLQHELLRQTLKAKNRIGKPMPGGIDDDDSNFRGF